MYTIDGSTFRRISYSNIWEIDIDICYLRDFTALEISDAVIIHNRYGLDLKLCKNLVNQSNLSFKNFNEGAKVPVIIPITAYKLGRILAKNSDYIQLSGDIPPEVGQEISNGMFYEIEQEKPRSNLIASYNFKFKYEIGNKPNCSTTMDIYKS